MSRARDLADSADLNFDDGTLVIDSGNVGIGTTTPSTTNLNTGTTSGIVVKSGGVAKNNFVALPSTGGAQWDIREAGGAGGEFTMRMFDTSGNHNVQINSNGTHFFNGGNVGIGTSSPQDALHINGSTADIRLSDSDNGNYSRIVGSSYDLYLNADAGNTGNGSLIFTVSGGSEAMRIDSSGNLLVGTTTNLTSAQISAGATGFALRGDSDQLVVSRDGGSTTVLNRNTSDGAILEFRKDGSTVGSIGSLGGDMYIHTPSGSDAGIRLKSNGINPCDSTGSNRDAAIDLGGSSARFKDLYLSGGVYLGGTGSANYLDDYEEGTFNPGFATSGGGETVAYDIQQGLYIKVGAMVMCYVDIRANTWSGGSGNFLFQGFPFTPANTTYSPGASGYVWANPTYVTSTNIVMIYVDPNSGTAEFRSSDGSSTAYNEYVANARMRFMLSYKTDA